MTDRTIIDKELKDLAEAFDRALEANLRLFNMSMRMHGVPKGEREEAIDWQRVNETRRRKVLLAECEAALTQHGHTIQ